MIWDSNKGVERGAHVVAWELANGAEVPTGLVVRHTCDNPGCVNPGHLLPGTYAQNTADAVERGRMTRGERVHFSRLTEAQVLEMRRRYAAGTETLSTLGREFDVDPSTISLIIRRVTWKHV